MESKQCLWFLGIIKATRLPNYQLFLLPAFHRATSDSYKKDFVYLNRDNDYI